MEAGKKNIPTLVENFASRQNSIPNPKSEKTIIYETVALTQMSPKLPGQCLSLQVHSHHLHFDCRF